ncbi:MAG: hypothetical protein LBN95_02785 [Prevotellaceae bacterium]|jgi:hypothetical protein|nr:hypothetical protein [Prevotellaceae bacterium]
MITQNITKQDFIINVIERDIKNIYRAQLAIAQSNIYVEGKKLKIIKRRGSIIQRRSGQLLSALQNPDYMFQSFGEKFVAVADYPLYIRFLDMKRIGNRRIYNRQIWGILYNNSLKDIKYNYGKEIYDNVGNALREIFEQKN